jgi:hypothetical protein
VHRAAWKVRRVILIRAIHYTMNALVRAHLDLDGGGRFAGFESRSQRPFWSETLKRFAYDERLLPRAVDQVYDTLTTPLGFCVRHSREKTLRWAKEAGDPPGVH